MGLKLLPLWFVGRASAYQFNEFFSFISARPVRGSHRLLSKRLRSAGQEFDGCLPNSSKPLLARPIFSSLGVGLILNDRFSYVDSE